MTRRAARGSSVPDDRCWAILSQYSLEPRRPLPHCVLPKGHGGGHKRARENAEIPASSPDPSLLDMVDAIRAWRDQTRGIYGPGTGVGDTSAIRGNNRQWWSDVDALLREIDGKPIDMETVCRAIAEAYAAHGGAEKDVTFVPDAARRCLKAAGIEDK